MSFGNIGAIDQLTSAVYVELGAARHLGMIEFDDIDNWYPLLSECLKPFVPEAVERQLANRPPQYVEDACDALLGDGRRDKVIDATMEWLQSTSIAGFHGTRLTDGDTATIRANGLIPLAAPNRRQRITRAMAAHPDWKRLEPKLDEVLQNLGPGNASGGREGQVHLTLSLAGLTESFNHYLKYGSEFDQHAIHLLVGPEALPYLERDGVARIVKVGIPGREALAAAHPYFTPADRRRNGEVPNIANEFLEAYAFRLSRPGYQSRRLKLDCGMVFRRAVPAEWIVDIQPWNQV